MTAIRRDQVLTSHFPLLAVREILRRNADTALVLLNTYDLGPLDQARPGRQRTRAQDGFETGLIQVQAAARAQSFDALIQAGHDVRQLAAGHPVHGHDGPFGNEVLGRLLADLVLDTEGTEQLKRAHVKECRARQRGAGCQSLDGYGAHSTLGEERGRAQTNQAPACDQYGRRVICVCIAVRHRRPLTCPWCRTCVRFEPMNRNPYGSVPNVQRTAARRSHEPAEIDAAGKTAHGSLDFQPVGIP